jgi:hypothetical protein
MEQMQTMTKSYGIAAVGRAAAATVMLPLAVGVDLIILPGPQVSLYQKVTAGGISQLGVPGTTPTTVQRLCTSNPLCQLCIMQRWYLCITAAVSRVRCCGQSA